MCSLPLPVQDLVTVVGVTFSLSVEYQVKKKVKCLQILKKKKILYKNTHVLHNSYATVILEFRH